MDKATNQEDWVSLDNNSHRYHAQQWEQPKFSTVKFYDFIKDRVKASRSIVDIGAGSGAPTAYFAQKNSNIKFTAFDFSHKLIDIGATEAKKLNLKNLNFIQGDVFDLKPNADYDGCISLQTLSWLPGYERAMLEIFKKIKPEWIGLTSLFYEGRISCKIEVTEHARSKTQFYNIYSLPEFNNFCKKHGYHILKFEPFKIEFDLPKPSDPDLMATYTQKLLNDNASSNKGDERLQISGPLLMNWYMLLIGRLD